MTPIDELYVIEKVWPGTKALATAVSPEATARRTPQVWSHEFRGARVFGTSLGHGNETFSTNQFKAFRRLRAEAYRHSPPERAPGGAVVRPQTLPVARHPGAAAALVEAGTIP